MAKNKKTESVNIAVTEPEKKELSKMQLAEYLEKGKKPSLTDLVLRGELLKIRQNAKA